MKLKGLGLIGLMVASGGANAAGFALQESSVSAMGTGFAGQAVAAQDASTMYANAAGLTEVQGRQFVLGGTVIQSSVKYTSTAGVQSGGDGGNTTPVPSAYYAMDLRPDLKLGFGLYAPFGLKTEYDTVWAGSSQGILSDLKTYDFNPTLAWKVNDKLSLGVGIDYQYIDTTLSGSPGGGVVTTMSGDDTAWGYNLGLMYRFDDATKLGLSYRSKVDFHLKGNLSANVPALPLPIGVLPRDINADLTLPDVASLALQHKVDERWTLLADVTWTGWSTFKNLDVYLSNGIGPISHTAENWKDVWRFGLGATYKHNDALTWRFGVAYDNSPVPDAAHRYARIPDSDRTTVAIGARYALSAQNLLDVAYNHLFFKDGPTTAAPLAGTFKGQADILGVQLTHNF